jgi:hypothetical protein
MQKDLSNFEATEIDIEKAKAQIEEIEYLKYICDQYDMCIFYDEYSNDGE